MCFRGALMCTEGMILNFEACYLCMKTTLETKGLTGKHL